MAIQLTGGSMEQVHATRPHPDLAAMNSSHAAYLTPSPLMFSAWRCRPRPSRCGAPRSWVHRSLTHGCSLSRYRGVAILVSVPVSRGSGVVLPSRQHLNPLQHTWLGALTSFSSCRCYLLQLCSSSCRERAQRPIQSLAAQKTACRSSKRPQMAQRIREPHWQMPGQ